MSEPTHDPLIRGVMSKLEQARVHLQGILPTELAKALDWRTLKLEPGSFVDSHLEQLYSDLLYSIRWKGSERELWLYLLYEHQSTADRWMSLRLLGYKLRVWNRYLEEHPETKALPAFFPMVLYHGRESWSCPPRFQDLLSLPPEGPVRAQLEAYNPEFRYRLIDLNELSEEEIPGKALGKLVLLLLKYVYRGSLWERLPRWAVLLRAAGAEGGRSAFEMIFSYIFKVDSDIPSPEIQQFLERELGPQAKEALVTGAQILEERGRLKGIEQGIEQGEQRLLLRQLERKYGPLSEAIRAKILSGTSAELGEWSLRVLDAPDLEGVFR